MKFTYKNKNRNLVLKKRLRNYFVFLVIGILIGVTI